MNKKHFKKGNVLTLTVIVFTMASLALSLGIISPIVKHIKNVRGAMYSKQAFYTAESLQEDILYRLKKNLVVSATETMTLGSSTAEAVISGTNDKTIIINSDNYGFKRKISATLVQGDGVSFSYGVQAGLGGFETRNGSKVIGNVYANGDITGAGHITGTAISATVPDPIADQSNTGSSDPLYNIVFGGNATPKDVAQGFEMSTTTSVSSVHLYVKKSSINPLSNVVVQVVNDIGGKPGGTVLGSVVMNEGQAGTSYGYVELPFSSNFTLVKNTPYWLVLYSPNSTAYDNYTVGATNNTYAKGKAVAGTWSGSGGGDWKDTSPLGLDIYFGMYISGKIGTIGDDVIVGTNGIGDVWANTVNTSLVAGTKYCKVGNGCNTTRPDPVPQINPISEGNITDWKEDARLGGVISSNKTIVDTETLGPKKIEGNLTVSGILNLSGVLWVTGDFTVNQNYKVNLSSSYAGNSGMIIVDGKTILENGATFSGSGVGATSSYVMLLSTNNCNYTNCGKEYAIHVSNNVRAVILNAQKGTIYFKNSSVAKSATANKIILENNVIITYEKGLIDINFSSGPSGAWAIDSWQESTQ